MKANIFLVQERNTGVLVKTEQVITLNKNRWLDAGGTSHPMSYTCPKAFINDNVYFLHRFGNVDGNSGVHISLPFWKNQQFLLLQGKHWIQQKDNIMWFVNIMVAAMAIVATLK